MSLIPVTLGYKTYQAQDHLSPHGVHDGLGPGQLRSPTGIAFDPSGNVWVSDATRSQLVYKHWYFYQKDN